MGSAKLRSGIKLGLAVMNLSEPHVHLEVGSRFENIDLVQVVVQESLQRLELDEDFSHSVSIAVREAVANAIKHGNQEDPGKHVEVDFGVEGKEIVIRVSDEGIGFDPEGVRDPLEPDNLLRSNGRGILFMKSFMDDIDYSFQSGGGTVVTMRKRITCPSVTAVKPEEDRS